MGQGMEGRMDARGIFGIMLAVAVLSACQQWSPEQLALLQRAQTIATVKLGTTLDADVLSVGSANESWACGQAGSKGEWAYVERQGAKPEFILPNHDRWDSLILECHNAPALKLRSAAAS